MIKTRRRNPVDVIHVVPDVLAVAAMAIPFVDSGKVGSAYDNSVQYFKTGQWGPGIQNLISSTMTNLPETILPAVELGVVAIAASWFGRKLGLNKIGTKRVKLA